MTYFSKYQFIAIIEIKYNFEQISDKSYFTVIIDKIDYVSKIKIILNEEIDFAKNIGLENVLLSTNKHGLTMR